ncbi:MAG: hypothetical protein ACE5IK_01980 [Acidobacteriota bacterium]
MNRPVPPGAARGNGRWWGVRTAGVVLLLLGGITHADEASRRAPAGRASHVTRTGSAVAVRGLGFRAATAHPRRPADRGLALPQEDRVQIESTPPSFGEVIPGEPRDLPGGLRVRVFAAGDWVLRLVPATPLQNIDRGGEPVPVSRLAWRSQLSGRFQPFRAAGTAVAQGPATGPAGRLVIVDLNLALGPDDATGRYTCRFDVVLERS